MHQFLAAICTHLHGLTEIFTSLDKYIYMSWQNPTRLKCISNLYALTCLGRKWGGQQRPSFTWAATRRNISHGGRENVQQKVQKNFQPKHIFQQMDPKKILVSHTENLFSNEFCLSPLKKLLQDRHEKFVPDTKTLKLFFILWKTDPIAW